MEHRAATSSSYGNHNRSDRDDHAVQQRLNELLRLNAEKARENALYRTDSERIQAALMTRPIPSQNVFAYFGLMIGLMPALSVIAKVMWESSHISSGESLLLVLTALTGLTTGIVGYAFGRTVPAAMQRLVSPRAPNNVFQIALIGFVWGAVSGGAGGVFLFLIGSIFGAIFGGIIGAVTLPILAAFHSALRNGDQMERKHFLPIALGTTMTLCAFIIGL